MTSILTDWGKRCIEKLTKGVIAEARFVFCLSCIANEFEEEKAKLEPERKTLEQRVKEAKGRNKNIAANVVSWEEEVDKLFQEETKAKQTCLFGFCPDCIWRYKRGKKLANDTEKIKGLIEKAEKFGNIEISRPPPGVERNLSSQDYISFESRLSKYNELLDALKDDNNYITGLHGMGGTGKTTLAIKVGKELKESGQFTYAIVTTVSSTPDIKKIQDDIAGPLGLELKDFNESDRPGKLWDRLTNGEKILLILDDVWDQNPHPAFDAIGIPKRDNRKGCRVLVTTRSKIMTFDKSIELELLSEDDAWIMFQWYAGISKSSPKYVIDKGCKIAKECKQLPIAIAGIASSLKGQQNRVDEWDVTLKSLKKPVSMQDVDPDKVGIFKCLKVSYDNLKNEKAKKLFLLCSVFQEDEEISIEDLTRISIGAGLFGEDYDTYDDARKDVAVAKNKLLDSCLLLEVRENFVKMHDLIRDVAQWIAGKEIQGVNLSNKNQKSLIEKETNIKCLLFEGSYKDLYFCKFDASKLETLIVIENREENYNMMEIPNSFFENIVNLRVLYLSCYGNRSLSLANSFHSLKNIRSMMVKTRSMVVPKVDLGDISVLGNLQSLEAIDLDECKIHELPIEIEKLDNLKLLRLESCEIGKGNPFEVIKKCSSLEELYFIDSFNYSCLNYSCLEITLPAKLRRYHIGIRKRHTNYRSHSKCVVLDERVYGYFTKGTLEYFMKTAEAIELDRSGWKNLMPEMVPIENGMNDLVELHLNYDSNLQCLIDTKQSDSQVPNVVFSKLVVLELCDMEKLEELCNSPISLDCLNNLKEVTIHNCNHLRSLFKCSLYLGNLKKLIIIGCETLISVFDLTSSQSLLQLETMEINFCKKLEKIFTYDGDNDNSKSCNSMFPNLKSLYIYGCDQLQFILPCHSAGDLLSLESISIYSCDKLTQMIKHPWDDTIEEKVNGDNDNSKSCNSMFPNLKYLTIVDCPQLQFILPCHSAGDLLSLESIWIGGCDKLTQLIKHPWDDTIEEKVNGDNDNSKSCNSMFPNLKKVNISRCHQLQFILPCHSAGDLLSLEYIRIGHCDKLTQLIKHPWDDTIEEKANGDNDRNSSCNSIMFPNLKKVYVYSCPQLEFVLPLQSAQDLLLLESIIIGSCDKLEYIFGQHQDVQLPSLKELKLLDLPNFIDIFRESNHSKTPTQLEPTKSNVFSWSHICCHRYKLKGPTSTEISLVSDGQPKDLSISLERGQCLLRPSHIMCNIKEIILKNLSKIKSVFVLSITSRMMLESLTIENCYELKHIIVDIGGSSGSDNTVFPKLKELEVKNCGKLEYIFGHIDDSDDHQNHNLHLPALKFLKLHSLPSLTGVCTKNYRTTFPALAELEFINCSQLDIKSIGDFIVKELSGNVEHFVALERLKVDNSNVESLCCLTEVSEREMNLGLQNIELYTLPMLTCLFKGLKKSFSIKNLTKMKIKGCEKLEFVFSTSIIMCLPQLLHIRIEECKELKHLIEDDLENRKTVCFPKLKTLVVVKCNKLENVFPISICKEFPELDALAITEADKLEEIFVCEGDEKVNIPNLKFVAFVNLPSLCQTQEVHFQAVRCHSIQHCKNFSLKSAPREDIRNYIDYFFGRPEWDIYREIYSILEQSQEETRDRDTCNDIAAGHMLTSSKELVNQQHSLGEIDTTIKPSHGNDNLEGSTSEKPVAEPLSTISGTENEPPIQVIDHKQKGIMISVEEGTTSQGIKSSFEDVDLGDSHETNQTNNYQVSLNDNGSKSEPSSSTTSPIACQIPSMPSKDFDLNLHMESLYRQFQEDSKGHGNGNENPNARTTKEFAAWVEAEAASWHALTSSKLEGSTSENTEAATFSTISETKNVPPIQLDVALKQKGNERSFEEGTTSTDDKSITSSTHSEVGDGRTFMPSSSIVNTKLPATKYVDIGDSHETIAIEDIDKLIKEDSLLAFEMFLTGVPSFSIRTLLQELKTLLDSSSDLDHLVSNKESKSKLISLLHGLNQHQELLPSDVKEFVEKVKTFFIDIINKHATYQQLLKKQKQLLDLKPGLLKKLLSAKSKQFHIVSETSTANAQIHKCSLETDELRKQLEDLENQIDDLKSVVNRCDVQKEELNAECSEWAQKSKEFASALASTEVDLREAERARNLATEGFSNLKSSFPTF